MQTVHVNKYAAQTAKENAAEMTDAVEFVKTTVLKMGESATSISANAWFLDDWAIRVRTETSIKLRHHAAET